MTYSMELPDELHARGWKVKIRNLERVEPPHVSIMQRTKVWRYGLRDPGFLDVEPSPRDVPDTVLEEVNGRIDELRAEWDRLYPANPVFSEEG